MFKKFMAAVTSLVFVMVTLFSMPVHVAADGEPDAGAGAGTPDAPAETYKVTVTNAIEGAEYNIYKLFDGTATDGADGSKLYAYTVPDDAEHNAVMGTQEFGFQYTVDATTREVQTFDETMVISEGNTGNIYAALMTALDTQTAPATGSVEFTDLTPGYYIVTSAVGNKAMFVKVFEDVEVTEKNEKPTVEKYVVNADGTDLKQDVLTSGTTYAYKAVIKNAGAQTSLSYKDTFDSDFIFDADSVTVQVGTVGALMTDPADFGTVTSTGSSFTIAFSETFLQGVSTADIIVTYNLSTDVFDSEHVSMSNTAKVLYGAGQESEESVVTLKPSKLEVFKYAKIAGADTALAGAKFAFEHDGADLKFIELAENEYMCDATGTITEIETDDTGTFMLYGLPAGYIDVRETEAPSDYNQLTESIALQVHVKTTDTGYDTGIVSDQTGVITTLRVLNRKGIELPDTGVYGMYASYVIGLMVFAGAMLLLVKRVKA